MDPIIITPYINEADKVRMQSLLGYKIPQFYYHDAAKIGSDLAYQTAWNMFPDRDIIILHTDMKPKNLNFYSQFIEYAKRFPEAGMLGSTLVYPVIEGKEYIQHAGGRFVNGEAIHYGGGLDIFSGRASRQLEENKGQYKNIREVAWSTFGGIYITAACRKAVGDFDPSYYWTYYRDVDYALTARKREFKIYQTPIEIIHDEGRDNKVLQSIDGLLGSLVELNRQIFLEKWSGTEYIKDIDRVISNE